MKVKFGEKVFNIDYNESWEVPTNSKKFMENKREWDLNYKIEFVDEIQFNNEQIIHNREDIIVTKNNKNLESRYLNIKGFPYPYAFYKEIDEKNRVIQVLNYFKNEFTIDTLFWSLFALEKHMIEKDSLILHCNYMVHNNHGILFSGPSGIGKSTQGDLWKKYRNASIKNGDKGLLLKDDGKWHVDGWPVCGSSEICENERHKIGAIVFLSQGKENIVTLLDKKSAIKKMISQITINYWNQDFVNKAFTLIEEICDNVNIYELTCTPDERAVEVLERALKENEIWMD